jgi:hypothetical protein
VSLSQGSDGRVSEPSKSKVIGAAERLINEGGIKDGKSLYQLICDQYKGRDRGRVLLEAFGFLGETNPRLAVELMRAYPEGEDKYALYAQAIWACHEFKSLRILFDGVNDVSLEFRSTLNAAVQSALERCTSDELASLAVSMPVGWRTMIDTSRYQTMGKEGAVSKFDALLATMPDWSRRQANENFITGLARHDVAIALSRLQETPNSPPSPEISSLVAGMLYAKDQEKGIDIILSGEDSKVNQDLLKNYVRIWFHASSEELSRYLNTLPKGSKKDSILVHFINSLDVNTEAEEVEAWKNQFHDASLRDGSGTAGRRQVP